MVHHTARNPLPLTLGQLLEPCGWQGAGGSWAEQAEYGTTASAGGVPAAEAADGGGSGAAAAAAQGNGGGGCGGHRKDAGRCGGGATSQWQLPKRRSVFFGHATANITRCVGLGAGCLVAVGCTKVAFGGGGAW